MIKDVTDLKVYQLSLELLDPVYKLSYLIPTSHQKLRKQLVESTESIAALIAEGYAKKRSEKEFKRFLQMAMGSSDEAITHLRVLIILSNHHNRLKVETCEAILEKYKIVSKQLQSLISKWVTYPSAGD